MERPEWWSVLLEFATDPDMDDAEQVDDLLEALDALDADAPVVSSGHGRIGVRLSVAAPDALDAVSDGYGLVIDVISKAGHSQAGLLRLDARSEDELDQELVAPNFPLLLGVAELAELLDVSKQRASELARSSTFPRPVADLASGPVWLEPTVQRFLEEWERRPGRPAQQASWKGGDQGMPKGTAAIRAKIRAAERKAKQEINRTERTIKRDIAKADRESKRSQQEGRGAAAP